MIPRVVASGAEAEMSLIEAARSFGAAFSFLCLTGGAVTGVLLMAPEAPNGPRIGTQTAEATTLPRADAHVVVAIPTSFSAAPPRIDRSGSPIQCALYARARTGIALFGAARAWWAQAEGRYQRTHTPQAGAVMAMGGTPGGHIAVVARVLSPREILIDHANWMGQGEVMTGALAVDVSAANDWSEVRVWHPPSNGLGQRAYPVQGFILPDRA
jgi:hypothetical protein